MVIKEFIDSIAGLSVNTQVAYEQTLWQLKSTIAGDEPTNEEIKAFLKSYSKASSLHRHKAAIKAYLEHTRPGQAWPFTSRQFIVPREEIIRFIPAEVVFRMADAAENDDDRMFVLTLFTLGCRISELRGITASDITPAGVQVLAKGNKFLLKVVTADFNRKLKEYAAGKEGNIFPESYSYYRKVIIRLGKAVGHPEVTPHMLRHARAVDLLDKGMDLSYVQQFLGHADISTTARYTLVTKGKLGATLEKLEGNGHNELD